MPRRYPDPPRVTAEERAQAQRVSLRRIARLFTEHRLALAIVTAIIVASSVIAMAQPFLLREVIDVALPTQDLRLLVWLVVGMVAIAAVTSVLGVVQTWISTGVGQRVMHRLRTDVFGHLQRQSLGFFTRTRTGEVQSRITNDIGGMQEVVTTTATSIASNLTTVVATAVAMAGAVVAAVAHLAGGHAAGDLPHPPRGADAARDRGAAPARARRPQRHHRGGSVGQRRAAEQDAGLRADADRAVHRVVLAADRPRAAVRAGRPVAVGGDERDLRRDPGGDLPRRVPALQTISIGTLVAFTALQSGLFRPLMGLLSVSVTLTSSLALFARIFEYLDLPVEVDDPADPCRCATSAATSGWRASATPIRGRRRRRSPT